MSLRRIVRSVARVGASIATGGIIPPVRPETGGFAMPSGFLPQIGGMVGGIGGALGRVLPGIGAAGGVLAAGGAVVRGVGAAARAANAWCGRNPAWCVSVGGLPAVLSMIESGQLPVPKRRRRRGLSPRDLRGFYKTARLMRKVAGTIGLRRGGKRGGGASSTLIAQN